VQYRRAVLAGVVPAGEGKLGFTGRLDGRDRALQRCRLGVGSGSGRRPRQGWPGACVCVGEKREGKNERKRGAQADLLWPSGPARPIRLRPVSQQISAQPG
jgi:hypothetical protein